MANTLKFKRGLLAGLPSAAVGEPLFTTDTFDLYIGTASGTQKYQKFIASGTTSQLLRGDGSLLTMPIVLSSPANGEVLKYNGTNWVNSSDAGITGSLTTNYIPKATSATTLGNSLIYDSGSFVGINTVSSTPANANASIFYGSTDSGIIYLMRTTGTDQLRFYTAGNRLGYINTASNILTLGTANYPLVFSTNDTERARITSGGNFIINNSSTDNGLRFQVTGDGYFSGRLNVGNTNTTYNLDVTGTGRFSNFILVNSAGSVTSGFSNGINLGTWDALGYETNDLVLGGYRASQWQRIRFYTLGTERMTLDASGNLGLGVTPSAWSGGVRAMQVGLASSIASRTGGSGLYIGDNYYFSTDPSTGPSTAIYLYSAAAATYRIASGQHQWYNAPSGTAGNAITFTQAMTLDASGRLGIGITSPSQTLHVGGNSLIVGGATWTTGVVATQFFGDIYGSIKYDYNTTNFTINSYGLFSIATNGTSPTTKLTVYANGNTQIGGSSDSGEKLQVTGTAKITGATTMLSTLAVNGSTLNSGGANAVFQANGVFGGVFVRDTGVEMYFTGTGTNYFGTLNNSALEILTNNATRLTIASTGAATFSSSVTANGFTGPYLDYKPGGVETFYIGKVSYNVFDGNQLGLATFTSLPIEFATANTKRMIITSTGNVGIGTITPSEKLHVSGNAIVTGNLTVDTNTLFVDATNNRVGIGTVSPAVSLQIDASKSNTTSTEPYNSDVIRLNNTNATTNALHGILLTRTNSSDLISVGAIMTQVTNQTIGSGAADMLFYTTTSNNISERMRITSGGDVGIGMTPSYKLDVSGSARVSDAIAIGTTPDTNLPFKILKNINSTVGIRFENTSTGASSFTGYQFGTDVSGGTAFTNFLYASSGVAETGVYKPNGTALINTGSGGLNFLAVSQPIRFFTSTGNGTLRAAITNDGDFTQYNGTNPSASTTDAFRMYSADITAGNAAPHFRTENGGIIKLYQQTTGVTSATYIGGAGTGLTDSDTFDGYTIAQIVKALRNAGLLA